jgi:hypothetical protein
MGMLLDKINNPIDVSAITEEEDESKNPISDQ